MPLIFAFLTALLSIACMVVSLWYGVLWLAGSVATAQGAGIFMLGRIGAVAGLARARKGYAKTECLFVA